MALECGCTRDNLCEEAFTLHAAHYDAYHGEQWDEVKRLREEYHIHRGNYNTTWPRHNVNVRQPALIEAE